MSGIQDLEDIPDGIAESDEKLLKAIAELSVQDDMSKKMDEYTKKLESLDKSDQANIAGIFSQAGKGMSADFAQSIVDGFTDSDTSSNAALLNQAKELGYDSIEAWADALNMTVEDFYDKAEENARAAVTARNQAYSKLNRILGTTDAKIAKTAQLSAGQEEALADKIIKISNISGTESAKQLKAALGDALDQAGEDAEQLASYLNSINWQDAGEWDQLPEVLSSMGIEWTTEIENFVEQARKAANAIELVDFEKLNEKVVKVETKVEEKKEAPKQQPKQLTEEQRHSVNLYYGYLGDLIIYEDYLVPELRKMLLDFKAYVYELQYGDVQVPLNEKQREAITKLEEMEHVDELSQDNLSPDKIDDSVKKLLYK